MDDARPHTLRLVESLAQHLEFPLHYFNVSSGRPPGFRIVRTPRGHTSPSAFSFVHYMTELISQIRDLAVRTINEPVLGGETPEKGFVEWLLQRVVSRCVRDRGYPDLILKIHVSQCVESLVEIYESVLCSVILEEARGEGWEASCKHQRGWVDPLEVDGLRGIVGNDKLSRFYNLITLRKLLDYFLFIRTFAYFIMKNRGPGEVRSFNLKRALNSLMGRAAGRLPDRTLFNHIVFILLNHCCYAGLAQYPLAVWNAVTYGLELPSATIEIYRPSRLRLERCSKGELCMPFEARDSEPYGYHHPWTLERYTRRWDLDSVAITSAIDLYYEHVYRNPWIRGAVYTSFTRTLESAGVLRIPFEKDAMRRSIVVPVVYPRRALEESVDMIPVPVVDRHEIPQDLRRLMKDDLYNLASMKAPPSEISEAATFILSRLESYLSSLEVEKAGRLREHVASLSGGCIRGFIVDALHPFAGFYLSSQVVERSIADVPSPARRINVLRRLTERLTEADYIDIQYYVIVDAEALLKEYRRYRNSKNPRRGPVIHTYAFNIYDKIVPVESYNLERVMKTVINIDDEQLSNYHCLDSLSTVNDIVLNFVRG
ncbi:MAG: hypothetical protein LRS49_00340 [Desulfurococcales archaeon]|nr:hypothetical protein [Desulfurococcales archaeon]